MIDAAAKFHRGACRCGGRRAFGRSGPTPSMPSPNQWPSKASSSPSSCVLVRTAATGWSPAFTASRRQLKWQEINCTVFDHMEADEAELAEIDENLIRTN